MLILTETTDAIEVQLAAAHTTTSVKCYATWRDRGASTFPAGRSLAVTTGVTAVDLVTGPAASTQRVIDHINVFNEDTVTHTVTIKFDANATEYKLVTAVLEAGEVLAYTDANAWTTYTASGIVRVTQAFTFTPISSGWTTVVLGADVVDSAGANTITDITALSFGVTAGQRYLFRALLFFTSAATTTGVLFSINGPATPTELYFRSSYSLSANSRTWNEGLSAYDTPAAANASVAATAANVADIEGLILPSATGTVIGRVATEVNASAITVKRGSILQYMAV